MGKQGRKAKYADGPRPEGTEKKAPLENRIVTYLDEHPEPPQEIPPRQKMIFEILLIVSQYKPGRWVAPAEVVEMTDDVLTPQAAKMVLTQVTNAGKIEKEKAKKLYRYK